MFTKVRAHVLWIGTVYFVLESVNISYKTTSDGQLLLRLWKDKEGRKLILKMQRSQPSLRLKQISRIISRQREDEDSAVTSSCVSIFVILFIIFMTGFSMLTSGLIIFRSCERSWLPTWLLVSPNI